MPTEIVCYLYWIHACLFGLCKQVGACFGIYALSICSMHYAWREVCVDFHPGA